MEQKQKFVGAAQVQGTNLRAETAALIADYLTKLEGLEPRNLHQLVVQEVEEPLFRLVLRYAEGNQSRAAAILGISRVTLRTKMTQYRIVK